MSPPARASRAKFHWGITFTTGLKPKLTKKQVGGKWILVREMTMISKDGEISKFPGYYSSEEEEPTEQPRSINKYGFDEDEPLGYEAPDKEVDSDLESTASSKPKLKKTAKAILDRTHVRNAIFKLLDFEYFNRVFCKYAPCGFPKLQIVTQVTNNVNNANGGNGGNGGNNGCTYKGFMTCNPKEYDGKGVAIALTRWIDTYQ
ncbi:hypothetical protein Tco_0188970 [Tanacetum coccineum]